VFFGQMTNNFFSTVATHYVAVSLYAHNFS
jgi:hypothetical protein